MSKRGDSMRNKITRKKEALERKLAAIDAKAAERKIPVKKELDMVEGWLKDMDRLQPSLSPEPKAADVAAGEKKAEGGADAGDGDKKPDAEGDGEKKEEEPEKPKSAAKKKPTKPAKKPASKPAAKKKR